MRDRTVYKEKIALKKVEKIYLFLQIKRRGYSTYCIRGTGIPCVRIRESTPRVVNILTYPLVHIKITSFLMRDSKRMLLIFYFKKNRKNM